MKHFLVKYKGHVVAEVRTPAKAVIDFARKHYPAVPASVVPDPRANTKEERLRAVAPVVNLIAISWVMPGAAMPDKETLGLLRGGADRFARHLYNAHRGLLEKSQKYRRAFQKKKEGG